jgi:hypothetical protein
MVDADVSYYNLQKIIPLDLPSKEVCQLQSTRSMAHVVCTTEVLSINTLAGDLSVYKMLSDYLDVNEIITSTSNSEFLQIAFLDSKKERKLINIRGNSFNNPDIVVHSASNLKGNSVSMISMGENFDTSFHTSFSLAIFPDTNTVQIFKIQNNCPTWLLLTFNCDPGHYEIDIEASSLIQPGQI